MSRRVAGVFFAVMFVIMAVLGTAAAVNSASAQNPEKTPSRCFSDVAQDNANSLYISYVAERGILQGFPDGSFHPGEGLTRAQAAVVVVKAAGLKTSTNVGESGFQDISSDHWAAPYVKAAADAGYIKGLPDGSYRPEDKLTRAQGMALLMRLCTHTDKVELPSLEDMDQSHWAAEPMAIALAAEMIGLSSDGKKVYPDAELSRGKLARAVAILVTRDSGLYTTKLTGTVSELKGEAELERGGKISNLKVGSVLDEGDCVKTGKGSSVRINYPDGSSTLIQENSKVVIKSSIGRSFIKKDGAAGVAVEFLNLDLKQGTVFGALASKKGKTETADSETAESPQGAVRLAALDQFRLAARQAGSATPWYKTAESKRVKVKVDMPWGVAAVRGTFIKVSVNQDGTCSVSCLTGSTEVSGNNGQTVTVGQGQGSSINGQGQPAGQPTSMSQADQQEFSQVQDWVMNTALQMDINQEAPLTPPTMEIIVDVGTQSPEQVETAVKTVLDALHANGIELRSDVIQNLRQQISNILSPGLQGQLGAVAGQLGQGTQGSSRSSSSSGSHGGEVISRSSNSLLQSLSVSHGVLSPRFNSNVFNYTLILTEQIDSIRLTPVTQHELATLRIQAENVSSGSSVLVNLDGTSVITINVTAQDGSASTYCINVINEQVQVSVMGQVLDIQGSPLNGAGIRVLQGEEVKVETSTINGEFTLQLPVGQDYILEASLADYRTETMTFTVTPPGPVYLETIRLQLAESNETGSISGCIIDAATGSPVPGVAVNIRQGLGSYSSPILQTTGTGQDGIYYFENLIPGGYTIELSAEGYTAAYYTVVVISGQSNANQNGTITRILGEGETRIVLIWGGTPRDLDSHLYGPASSQNRFEVYFGNQQHYENDEIAVQLDVDDTSGFGPETTTIYNQTDGIYSFVVHNWSGETSLGQSQGQVRVYSGENLAAVFNVPGNRNGEFWEVFTLEGSNIYQVNRVFDWVTPGTTSMIYYNNPEQPDLRMELGDNSLLSVSNGSAILEPGTDYIIDGYNSVYITWHYLNTLPMGEYQLVFAYEGDTTDAVNIEVKERLAQVGQPWWGEGNSTVVYWEPVQNAAGYNIMIYVLYDNYPLLVNVLNVTDPSSCQYDIKEYLTEIASQWDGDEYAAAVYAVADEPYEDGPLSPLSEVKRFITVPWVEIVEAIDTNDNGDASDIQISFQPPDDQSGIVEYRVILVKNEPSLSIGEALNLALERYAVIEVGEEMPVTLPAGLLDADGETIGSDIPYYVYVLVVADEEQAQFSRLCGYYTPVYLQVDNPAANILPGGESISTFSAPVSPTYQSRCITNLLYKGIQSPWNKN